MQTIYRNHTFHLFHVNFSDWIQRTPRIHSDAITSIRVTGGSFHNRQDYKDAWNILASIPKLENLLFVILGCTTDKEWRPDALREVTTPIKTVQQETLQSFDVVFELPIAWFPDDEAQTKIIGNLLHYNNFLIDQDRFPAFKGIHPRCRIIGGNAHLPGNPIRNDMPNMSELMNWFSWFPRNEVPDAHEVEGYSYFEIGSTEAARVQASNLSAEEQAERQQRILELEEKLDLELKRNNDPETQGFKALNHALFQMDSGEGDEWPSKWTFPERPSWIPEGTTLEQPYDLGETAH